MAEKEQLGLERKSVLLGLDESEKIEMNNFGDQYIEFLNECKTERETVDWVKKECKKRGFVSLENSNLTSGQKIQIPLEKRGLILAHIGNKSLKNGFRLLAAHVDSPRLDFKPIPLVEQNEVALFKTHYYGGVKKYQWVSIPLEIRGTVCTGDGKIHRIQIGSDPKDPVFTIPDLLPHLSGKIQGEKKFLEGIEGEQLNLISGIEPSADAEQKERVKQKVLDILNKKYGFCEEDLVSAELQAVPAHQVREVGLDLSLIGGYGHDDRSCTYASAQALFQQDQVSDLTSIVLLVDKEEIGSYGISGIRSRLIENALTKLLYAQEKEESHWNLMQMFENSFAISADVASVLNPNFAQVQDEKNAAKIGQGVVIKKYTGARGKSGGSDASAELVGKIRNILNKNGVKWQSGTMGKVDEGGGGTVALYLADLGIQVLDMGVGVMGMHSPYELISKADLYETFKAYYAFLSD